MTDPKTVRTYAENLNKLLEKHDMSQRKFADMMDLNYKSFVNYCTAKCLPNLDTMIVISKFFKVPIEQMCSADLKVEEVPDNISMRYAMLSDDDKATVSRYINLLLSGK